MSQKLWVLPIFLFILITINLLAQENNQPSASAAFIRSPSRFLLIKEINKNSDLNKVLTGIPGGVIY